MSTTTNYSLELPQKGQKDWNTHLNGNFTKIDTEIHKNASNIGDITQLSENDLVSAINKNATSLADIAININDFIGNNDSEIFINACSYCITNNKPLFLSRDILLDASIIGSSIEIPSIIGGNKKSTITITGNISFIIDNDFYINNIIAKSNFVYHKDFPNSNRYLEDTTFWFGRTDDKVLNNITIENFEYINTDAITDGTYRTKPIFRFLASNIFTKNITIHGTRVGFNINYTPRIYSNMPYRNLTVSNVHFKNTECGYVFCGTRNITIDNISLENTETQSQNYYFKYGADLFCCAYCKDMQITKIKCEYPVERIAYIQVTSNVNINGVIIGNSSSDGGIKFVGFQNKLDNLMLISKNLNVNNVTFTGKGSANSGCFILYEVDNVKISNVIVNTESPYSSFLEMERAVNNLTLDSITINQTSVNFAYFTIHTSRVVNNVNFEYYRNYLSNLTIKNCKILNPITTRTTAAPFIMVSGDMAYADFKNWEISSNTIIQTIVGKAIEDTDYYEPASMMTYLTDPSLDGLIFEGNIIKGSSSKFGFLRGLQPGNKKYLVRNQQIHLDLATSYMTSQLAAFSPGSEVTYISKQKDYGIFSNKVIYFKPETALNNLEAQFGLTNFIGEIKSINILYASEQLDLLYSHGNTSYNKYTGYGEIMCENGDFVAFKVIINGSVIKLIKLYGDGTQGTDIITLPSCTLSIYNNKLKITNGASKNIINFNCKYFVMNYIV